jgi:hypothetical protein
MKFITYAGGAKAIKFTMHGKPRMWAGTSYLRILASIPKEWLREREQAHFTRGLIRSWFKAQE